MKKLIELLKANWYAVLLHVVAFSVLVEIIDQWVFAPVFLTGLIVWGYKKVNK